ncbi:transcriptional regulator [Desulfosporosinus sp. I2]|uniref:transcriptional regulator n=1 Tax=Desulfosporosinus sp. I2 TaxID=1617025 RepID=UPI0009E6530D|nr:transcriptional regulator [Desulfosporosinus sp. I2]
MKRELPCFFGDWLQDKKTVKELRIIQHLTVKELADKIKLDTVDILKIDDQRLRDIAEPLRSKLTPIPGGDYMDNMTWL